MRAAPRKQVPVAPAPCQGGVTALKLGGVCAGVSSMCIGRMLTEAFRLPLGPSASGQTFAGTRAARGTRRRCGRRGAERQGAEERRAGSREGARRALCSAWSAGRCGTATKRRTGKVGESKNTGAISLDCPRDTGAPVQRRRIAPRFAAGSTRGVEGSRAGSRTAFQVVGRELPRSAPSWRAKGGQVREISEWVGVGLEPAVCCGVTRGVDGSRAGPRAASQGGEFIGRWATGRPPRPGYAPAARELIIGPPSASR